MSYPRPARNDADYFLIHHTLSNVIIQDMRGDGGYFCIGNRRLYREALTRRNIFLDS